MVANFKFVTTVSCYLFWQLKSGLVSNLLIFTDQLVSIWICILLTNEQVSFWSYFI